MPWYEVVYNFSYRRYLKAVDQDEAIDMMKRILNVKTPSRWDPDLDWEITVSPELKPEYVRIHKYDAWHFFEDYY
ncbi:MAG: hypothetical protein ABSE39_01455 [Candidatus Bathyarchaeia archaeon]